MSKIKSWRWSKLLDPPAYKRLVTHPEWIMPFIISMMLLFFFYNDETLTFLPAINGLCWLALALLIVSILQTICCADDYYKIRLEKKVIRKIYIYTSGFFTPHQTARIVIADKDYEISEEIEPHAYTFHQWDDFSSFIFCTKDNQYYYSSPVYEAELLGTPLSATAFYQTSGNRLVILDGYGTTTLDHAVFFLGGVYIPPRAKQNIRHELTKEKVIPSGEYTQDYLITKHGKTYRVYGLSYDKRPVCLSLIIPTVIFKEGTQDVILKWIDNKGYREFYRSRHSVKRSVSDVLVELTYPDGIGGTVRQFNERTNRLDLIYKGYFHAIDFDSGAIIGDNGFEYNPS